MTADAPSPDVETVLAAIRAASVASLIPGSLTRYVSMRDVELIFAAALRGAGHQCDHDAEAHNLAHEVDRVRERLWRLAALAGWRSGNPADNDATAELYVTEALRGAGLPEPRACPTAVIDAWFVAVEWDRLSPDSPILPRYVGPFPSRVDAEAWGLANIRNGSWDILRLAQPFSVIPPEVTEEATP
jgi:hypothetical protein